MCDTKVNRGIANDTPHDAGSILGCVPLLANVKIGGRKLTRLLEKRGQDVGRNDTVGNLAYSAGPAIVGTFCNP